MLLSSTPTIETRPPSNPFDWNNVVKVFHDGAFGILFFLVFVYVLSKNGVKEAWQQHKKLMVTLTDATEANKEALDRLAESSEVNAQALKYNAESLRRLSKTNSKVAEIMSSNLDEADKQKRIMIHLGTSPDIVEED